MFMPTLAATGTPAQIAEWMPRALAPSIIGCFAQTELAHGSNVRALETTATHDPRTHEFELNTPSLGATKFWPGGLGNTSTHAVVMAQLVTADGGRHGVHGFIVPLRSPVDHTPLPGVSVGDIGPKMGYHDNDNGFLFLSHVRIPGAHMLARHARVTPAGAFERLAGAREGRVRGTHRHARAHRRRGGERPRARADDCRAVQRREAAVCARWRRERGADSGLPNATV
jgi:acyl-CoA oxidase